ncbi:CmcI family methyltransferase [Kitasatospora sp. NPDC058170]|uniref:CmcI family methyltransferase n=1 Tax=Kitasatospora sp. NPDC058170 TaxID=3346364 RepID=UPI0036D841EB
MTIDRLIRQTHARVAETQQGVPTYYDRRVIRQEEEHDPAWRARLEHHLADRGEGRFVSWPVRAGVRREGLDPYRRSELPDETLIMSQGTAQPMRWRGGHLFKSVYDFALTTMLLEELRPAGILEIGSGTGTSALWLADLAASIGFPCRIVSLDLQPVEVSHPSVEFVVGDARRIGEVLSSDVLADGPRLVFEDAHVGVAEVLDYVHPRLREGDYLVVEDSVGKTEQLAAFDAAHPGEYAVDTGYTDFFGRNTTSCVDSILRRMA